MGPGLSFSPLNAQAQQQGATQTTANPLQDAIKILSFRLPSVVGALGSAPPLAGNPGDSMAQSWLEQLFRGMSPAASGGQMPGSPSMTGGQGPMGPSTLPPIIRNVAPPTTPGGPSGPSAPPPNVVYSPPDTKTGDTGLGPMGPSNGPSGPPSWRDWLTPGGPSARF